MNLARLWPVPRPAPVAREDDNMIEFQVIGELRHDPGRLLLHGDDGRCYGYDLETGDIAAIELDDDWRIDVDCAAQAPISTPLASIAS